MNEAESINILMVDDKPENLLALEAILTDMGLNLVKAASGKEALKYILEQDFAVILLDVQMPEMDGFETARYIRMRPQSQYTPIIFITAFGVTSDYVAKGYEAGAVDYIFKPVVPEILRAKVKIFVDLYKMSKQIAHQAEQLAATNQELQNFTYTVSHDLRAPLRAIESFSKILFDDYRDKVDDKGKHYFDRIVGNCGRMTQLIEDLLRLSRLSRQEMNPEAVDLSALALSIKEELITAEPRRKVEFSITPDLTAHCDARLLREVLENLCGNAWKFTRKKSPAKIEFGSMIKDGQPAFYVKDNGAGFDMKQYDKLFGVFQRLHSQSDFEGTGIGLASVRRIIHRHNGRIWAEGKVGEGAAFYFTIG